MTRSSINPLAPWLPSRHHFASFRLLALVMFLRERRRTHVQDENRTALWAIDEYQSQFENYSVAAIYTLLLSLDLLAALQLWTGAPALVLIALFPFALFLAPAIYQVLLYGTGAALAVLVRAGILRNGIFQGPQAWVAMIAFTALSARVALLHSWFRFSGMAWLLLVALNALAAIVAFALRGMIASVENEYGGVTSDV